MNEKDCNNRKGKKRPAPDLGRHYKANRYHFPSSPSRVYGFSNMRNCNEDIDNVGVDLFYSETDPNGSYTGVPADKDDKPVQDADDL